MSSVALDVGSPSGSHSLPRPSVSERPQIGERLARVARISSSRSVSSLEMVCSCGRTSSPGGSIPSAPITPVVEEPPVGRVILYR